MSINALIQALETEREHINPRLQAFYKSHDYTDQFPKNYAIYCLKKQGHRDQEIADIIKYRYFKSIEPSSIKKILSRLRSDINEQTA
jgi:hypothetical protein